MKKLLSGNEAIARGAFEAGCGAAFGYPGTPSTEILENFVKYKSAWCEWSPNEKVALEAAAGAAFTGVRTIATMKLVGLNVAADPLMTLAYIGVEGGLVIIVADDPGQHSSQTEQDTRHYARLAKVPVLEPGNAEECRAYMRKAFEISEKFRTPVILRTTTCVSHSRGLVELGDELGKREANFSPDSSRFVPLPSWGRAMRRRLEEKLDEMGALASEKDDLNTVLPGGENKFGIISHGVTAFHCREIFPAAKILKLGWAFPFPDKLLLDFAKSVDELIVIEEGDPIIEEHIKSLGVKCDGKNKIPRCGELTPTVLARVAKGETPEVPRSSAGVRLPTFCAACPHRALFYALSRIKDLIVCGDIGCYTLGAYPPFNRTATCLCMGGGFTVAHGMLAAGEKRKVVGVLGDSTFFHSGITGLIDVVYNKTPATLLVLDNRITAMTGHQDHPGTGQRISGEPTKAASIEAIAKACGVERIFVCDPFDVEGTIAAVRRELEVDEPSLIISRSPCPLHERKANVPRTISREKCKNCKACLQCGCPALGEEAGSVVLDPALCAGCDLCARICKFGAITPLEPWK